MCTAIIKGDKMHITEDTSLTIFHEEAMNNH